MAKKVSASRLKFPKLHQLTQHGISQQVMEVKAIECEMAVVKMLVVVRSGIAISLRGYTRQLERRLKIRFDCANKSSAGQQGLRSQDSAECSLKMRISLARIDFPSTVSFLLVSFPLVGIDTSSFPASRTLQAAGILRSVSTR